MTSTNKVSIPLHKLPTTWLKQVYDWTIHWADTPYGLWALFILAFTEASFFIIPPDVLLIALCLGATKRNLTSKPWTFWKIIEHTLKHPIQSTRWLGSQITEARRTESNRIFKIAFVCTMGSVLGGMAGYAIGWGMWAMLKDIFIPHIFSQHIFDQVVTLYRDNALITVFTAAFTPIPYKVITIAAGASNISFSLLIIGSLVGRGGRFFLVALMIYAFGPPVKSFIERYFSALVWIFSLLLVGGFLLFKVIV